MEEILPLGMKSNKFGKWSPSWEGPYKIIKVISGNLYMVETVQGERLPRAINGRYLRSSILAYGKVHEDEDGRYWISPLVFIFFDLYALCKTYTSG